MIFVDHVIVFGRTVNITNKRGCFQQDKCVRNNTDTIISSRPAPASAVRKTNARVFI